MRLVVSATPQKAATLAARHIARKLRQATAERGVATLALSGGNTAPALFAELARQPLDWATVRLFQVDERVAPAGAAARNLTAIEQALVVRNGLPRTQLHAMPVNEPDLEVAASAYARDIAHFAGQPPVLDVVHLGLGGDGHTASLFPGDAVLDAGDRNVACTGPQSGHRRMTLTFPVINAARHIVWYVSGAAKREPLARLVTRGWQAPAGRVARRQSVIYADRAAKGPA